MYINQIFELSMVLDQEHFRKVFSRSYSGDSYIDGEDGEYIDRSLSSKGITVIYRDSQYKKKIRLIVNAYLILGNISDIGKLIQKLDRKLSEYFNYKYRLKDFVLSGMNFVTDIDVETPANVQAYLKVFKRVGKVKGFSPSYYDCFGENASFCLDGNSNGIQFLIYDLENLLKNQLEKTDIGRKDLKTIAIETQGILRAEVRLTKPKTIRDYTDATDNVLGQIGELSKNSQNVFMDTFVKVIPYGDYYKKGQAEEIIKREVRDSVMKRKMLHLLALVPEKKSLYLAQKAMNCRNIEKVMESFAKINVSPVTISKRQKMEYLESLYACLL